MKKKLIALTLGSIIATGGIIGGTFAYFNDIESSTANTFSAGTLTMESFRNDIPIEGPMFYTEDSLNGAMGTGLWQPGDSHTRGIYIENTGSLDAKLSKLYAVPEDAVGSDGYNNALAFADQANVIISYYEWAGGNVDSTAWATLLKLSDDYFKNHYNSTANRVRAWWDGKTLDELKQVDMDALAVLREDTLNHVFVAKNALGQDVLFTVKEVYTGELKDLVTPGHDVPASLKKVVKPNQTMLMGYTVQMQNLTPEVNNPLQGKEVRFSFAHEFVQN
ncbi:TasA family protein [Rossellomorea aquimaris]|uniref:Uncharacterized protein n=1 Tax=Rossellomorea aquimaris TaxID=189382 RepID=A0A5D4TW73_9BACI|nr:TasA family protein [Rossellomorea aquimaris]TYS78446.1 hypothetical protein FZC80_11860 [Rossellomorea aquimaris]